MGDNKEKTACVLQETILKILSAQGSLNNSRLREMVKFEIMSSFDKAIDDLSQTGKIGIKGSNINRLP